MFEKINIDLTDVADNAKVVLNVRHIAALVGFDKTTQFMIATAASELSTNVIRYARKGVFSVKYIQAGAKKGIEIMVEDDGPGIPDIEKAMSDNFSTGGGLGLGLSSVKRIMDEFYIETKSGKGTLVVAKKWIAN